MKPRLLLLLAVGWFLTGEASANAFRLPATRYLYLLVHGEDGRGKANTFRVFTSESDNEIGESDHWSKRPGNGGLKKFLETRYGISGHVFAYQFRDPSAPLSVLSNEFSSWFGRAIAEWKSRFPNGIPPSRFIVVAHSSGGLVLRKYLTGSDYRADYPIDLAITVNTPHHGTPYTEVLQILEGRNLSNRAKKIALKSLNASLSEDAKGMVKDISGYYENARVVLGICRNAKELLEATQYLQATFAARLDDLSKDAKALGRSLSLDGGFAEATISKAVSGIRKSLPDRMPKVDVPNLNAVRNLTKELDIQVSVGGTNMLPWLSWMQSRKGESPGELFACDDVFAALKALEPFSEKDDSYWENLALSLARLERMLRSSHLSSLTEFTRAKAELEEVLSAIPRTSTQLTVEAKANALKESLKWLEDKAGAIAGFAAVASDIRELSKNDANFQTVVAVLEQVISLGKTLRSNSIGQHWAETAKRMDALDKALPKPETLVLAAALARIPPAGKRLQKHVVRLAEYELVGELEQETHRQTVLQFLADLRTTMQTQAVSLAEPEHAAREWGEVISMWGILEFWRGRQETQVIVAGANQIQKAFSPVSRLEKSLSDLTDLDSFARVDRIRSIVAKGAALCGDIVEMAKSAEELRSQSSALLKEGSGNAGSGGAAGSGLSFDAGDAISSIMMIGSLSKWFGFAENHTSSSSTFNMTIKKLVKKLSEEIWKEVMSGAVTEMAFSHAVRANTSVAASDPIMQDIAMSDESEVRKMLSDVPEEKRHLPEFGVVYTRGVLSPSLEAIQKMGWDGAAEFTTAIVRSEIRRAVSEAVGKAKDLMRRRTREAIEHGLLVLARGTSGMEDDWAKAFWVQRRAGPVSSSVAARIAGLKGQTLVDEINGNSDLRKGLAALVTSMPEPAASLWGIDPRGLTQSLLEKELPRHWEVACMNGAGAALEQSLRGLVRIAVAVSMYEAKEAIEKEFRERTTQMKTGQEKTVHAIAASLDAGDLVTTMLQAREIGAEQLVRNIVIANAMFLAQDKMMDELEKNLSSTLAGPIDQLASKAGDLAEKGLEALQNELGSLGALADPRLILSVYNATRAIKEFEGMSVGAMLFALFASPSLGIALYDNGSFFVPASSSAGGEVALFGVCPEVKRIAMTVDDPLSPFIGVIATAIALEVARHFVIEPATKEALRVAKIVAVAGLSIAILAVKHEDLQNYFLKSHRDAIRDLYRRKEHNRPVVENLLFGKPVVAIERF